jgi:tripartite motif-containing protein 71
VPGNLTAVVVSSSQINLTWTDTATSESGFRIERCNGAGCTSFAEIATVGANVTTYQNIGLLASTSFSYRVRAYNQSQNSGYSNTASASTGVEGLSAPSNLVAVAVSSSQINLTWTDTAANESGFRIERCRGASCTPAEIATVGANVTSYRSTVLLASTTYTFRVRAFNQGGTSAYSNTASASTAATQSAAASDPGRTPEPFRVFGRDERGDVPLPELRAMASEMPETQLKSAQLRIDAIGRPLVTPVAASRRR